MLFDENDDLSDEEYYTEADGPKYIPADVPEDDAVEDTDGTDDETEDSVCDVSQSDISGLNSTEYEEPTFDHAGQDAYVVKSTGKYKPKGFSQAFLRTECVISVECNKTLCKFEYRGSVYTGKVLKKLNSDKYVFDVEKQTAGKDDAPEKGLKVIYIPDASFISGKTPY